MSEYVSNFGSIMPIATSLPVPGTSTAYSDAFAIDDGYAFSVALWAEGVAVDLKIVKQYSFSTDYDIADAIWIDTESDGTEDVLLVNYTRNGLWSIDSVQPKFANRMRFKFIGNVGNGFDARITAIVAKQRKGVV